MSLKVTIEATITTTFCPDAEQMEYFDFPPGSSADEMATRLETIVTRALDMALLDQNEGGPPFKVGTVKVTVTEEDDGA